MVTSKTTQKWGMLAHSSLLHCGVSKLVLHSPSCEFLDTDYFGSLSSFQEQTVLRALGLKHSIF